MAAADSAQRAGLPPLAMRCRYCYAEATDSVLIEEGQGLKFDITVEVCGFHHGLLTREQPTSVDSLRRRHAKGIKQLSIFDMPGLAPDSAIRGG